MRYISYDGGIRRLWLIQKSLHGFLILKICNLCLDMTFFNKLKRVKGITFCVGYIVLYFWCMLADEDLCIVAWAFADRIDNVNVVYQSTSISVRTVLYMQNALNTVISLYPLAVLSEQWFAVYGVSAYYNPSTNVMISFIWTVRRLFRTNVLRTTSLQAVRHNKNTASAGAVEHELVV